MTGYGVRGALDDHFLGLSRLDATGDQIEPQDGRGPILTGYAMDVQFGLRDLHDGMNCVNAGGRIVDSNRVQIGDRNIDHLKRGNGGGEARRVTDVQDVGHSMTLQDLAASLRHELPQGKSLGHRKHTGLEGLLQQRV